MKNIEACKGLAQITRTSMGPNGGLVAESCQQAGGFRCYTACWRNMLSSGRLGSAVAAVRQHCCSPYTALSALRARACGMVPTRCRHEQDGDQPPREAVRDKRCGHHHRAAGGAAPRCQAGGHSGAVAAAGDRRRHQLCEWGKLADIFAAGLAWKAGDSCLPSLSLSSSPFMLLTQDSGTPLSYSAATGPLLLPM